MQPQVVFSSIQDDAVMLNKDASPLYDRKNAEIMERVTPSIKRQGGT